MTKKRKKNNERINITKECLIKLHNDKFLNQSEIARMYGCSSSKIQNLFKKFNIKLLKAKDIVVLRGNKKCSDCGVVKDISIFHKSKERSDGLDRRCKDCSAIRSITIKIRNKEKNAKLGIDYSKTKLCPKCNVIKKLSKFSRSNGKSTGVSVYCKECESNFRSQNRETISLRNKIWRKNNPEKSRAGGRRRRDRARKLDCDYSADDEKITTNVFGYECFNCKSKNKLCIDHHYPLSKGFGLSISNAVVLCMSCNISKGSKFPCEFYSKDRLIKLDTLLKKAILLKDINKKRNG